VFQYLFQLLPSVHYLSDSTETSITKHITPLSRSMVLGFLHGMVLSVIICWFQNIAIWLFCFYKFWSMYIPFVTFHRHWYLFTHIAMRLCAVHIVRFLCTLFLFVYLFVYLLVFILLFIFLFIYIFLFTYLFLYSFVYCYYNISHVLCPPMIKYNIVGRLCH
jgi:hypothetical protein